MENNIVLLLAITLMVAIIGIILITIIVILHFTASDRNVKDLVNDINKRLLTLASEVIFNQDIALSQESVDTLEKSINEKDKEMLETLKEKQAHRAFNPFEINVEDPDESDDIIQESSNIK
jgi:hypothetical protein